MQAASSQAAAREDRNELSSETPKVMVQVEAKFSTVATVTMNKFRASQSLPAFADSAKKLVTIPWYLVAGGAPL